MKGRDVAVFCMPGRGHVQRLRSLVAGLTRRGLRCHTFTHADFRADLERAGGSFVDLFARYPLEAADGESWPLPVQFVSFAGHHAEAIRADLERLRPGLVIHDTFAVVGKVMARLLGVPDVNVCAGHDVVPARFLEVLHAHPRVKVSEHCWRAVEALRSRHGFPEATPFSYCSALSRDLNVYGEPAAFLPEPDRAVFEPLAYWGCLPDSAELVAGPGEPRFGSGPALKVYVSFGTMIWGVRQNEALSALRALATAFSRRGNVRALISLGGAEVPDAVRAELEQPGVRVERFVDQWQVLQQADVFVTHQGPNSAHEAIYHGVPMISYPFIWDQPGMAATCEQMGLAVRLVETPMGEVRPDDVDVALGRVLGEREAMRAALLEARARELEVIAGRPAVLDRILAL